MNRMFFTSTGRGHLGVNADGCGLYGSTTSVLLRLIDAIEQPVLVFNELQCVSYANAAFCQRMGYALEQLVGKLLPLPDRKYPGQRRVFSRRWLHFIYRRSQWRGVLNLRQADGSHRVNGVQVFPVTGSGGQPFMIALFSREPACYPRHQPLAWLQTEPAQNS